MRGWELCVQETFWISDLQNQVGVSYRFSGTDRFQRLKMRKNSCLVMTLIFFSPRVVLEYWWPPPHHEQQPSNPPTHYVAKQGVRKLCRCNNSWTICYTRAQLEAPANIRGVGWVLSMWWWTSTPHPPSDIGTIHSVSTSRSTIHVAHYTQQNRCSSTTHRDREHTIQSVSRPRRASTRSGPL